MSVLIMRIYLVLFSIMFVVLVRGAVILYYNML